LANCLKIKNIQLKNVGVPIAECRFPGPKIRLKTIEKSIINQNKNVKK